MAVHQTATRILSLAMGAAFTLGMVGCSGLQMQESGATAGAPLTVSGLQGAVHGGQQPVTGSTIQLYSAGLTGYGSNAIPLLPTSGAGVVTSNSQGYFTLPTYTCPANSYVYITATGGNPQVGGAANANIAMMAALGNCATLQANSATQFITINELTTIAGVYALQQFTKITAGTTLTTSPGNAAGTQTPAFTIGSSATNLQGLINAFGIANVLVNTSAGTTPGANTTNTQLNVEVWQIDTLADILASCINTDPTVGAGCTTLFNDTVAGLATAAPVDTLQAAYIIAQNPGNNVTNLLGLASSTAPFQPIDTAANDFTIGFAVQPAATYGIDLGTSAYIAFDSFGNAWVTNADVSLQGTGSSPYNTNKTQFVTEFDPQGNLIGTPMYQYNTGTTAAPAIATMGASITGNGSSKNLPFEVYIDPANNAWTTDPGSATLPGAIIRIPGSSSAGGANGYNAAAGALAIPTAVNTKPSGLAIDGNGNVYVSFIGSATYSATFGSSNTGEGVIVPTGTTAGPLGGGTMLPDNGAATTATVYLTVDNTSAATYAGAPFLDVTTQSTCTLTSAGLMAQYFLGSGTNTGSSSNTVVAPDTLTPLSLISDSATYSSCGTKKSSLPNLSVMYNSTTFMTGSGTAYTLPATEFPLGTAVDAGGNLWVLNTGIVSNPTGYPVNGLTKITPTYTVNPTTGALTASYTAIAVNGGGLGLSTTPLYIAIDGNGNVWTAGQQTGTGGAVSSHSEFDNNGNPLSPSGETTLKTSTVVTGWFGGNSSAGTSNGGLVVASGTERSSQTRRGIAVDLSGNVWTTDNGSQGKTLFILVGQAGPVQTPLSLALKNGTVGKRP